MSFCFRIFKNQNYTIRKGKCWQLCERRGFLFKRWVFHDESGGEGRKYMVLWHEAIDEPVPKFLGLNCSGYRLFMA